MEKFQSPSKVVVGHPYASVFGRFEFGDKSNNIQFQGLSEEQKKRVLSVLDTIDCLDAKPFVQGNSHDWLMIEFWSSDMVNVSHACHVLAKSVGLKESDVPGLSHPDFPCVFE